MNLESSYLWGLDISGTLTDAGGVGSLLSVITSNPTTVYHPSFDGNGNITAWTQSGATAPVCRREYDAFGNIVVEQGTAPCAFGFSTKLEAPETHLLYYGHRWHDPLTGRWPSRHGWHTAPSAIEERFPPRPEPGDRCTAAGCFSGDINKHHPGAVHYKGEVFWDPKIPDWEQTDTDEKVPRSNQPGYLWSGADLNGNGRRIIVNQAQAENTYSTLSPAVDAAKKQAEEDCEEKGCPCKSVRARVNCISSTFLDFQTITTLSRKPVLCSNEYLYDCKKEKWVDNYKLK